MNEEDCPFIMAVLVGPPVLYMLSFKVVHEKMIHISYGFLYESWSALLLQAHHLLSLKCWRRMTARPTHSLSFFSPQEKAASFCKLRLQQSWCNIYCAKCWWLGVIWNGFVCCNVDNNIMLCHCCKLFSIDDKISGDMLFVPCNKHKDCSD